VELREKIADIVEFAGEVSTASATAAADAILSLPELKEALEWVAARRDMLYGGGAGFVRVERVPPEHVYIEPKD
jgi:hypothetical protein